MGSVAVLRAVLKEMQLSEQQHEPTLTEALDRAVATSGRGLAITIHWRWLDEPYWDAVRAIVAHNANVEAERMARIASDAERARRI